VGEAIEGLNPDFVVYNRFNSAIMYTKGSDYTVASENGDDEDGSKRFTYTFTLISTGEKKSVYQNVYYATKGDVVSLTNFKVSYLKNVVVNKLPTANGYLTISGQVVRNDGTLYYLVLDKGSTPPPATRSSPGVPAKRVMPPRATPRSPRGTFPLIPLRFPIRKNTMSTWW
jgi:hypothetical protein